MAAAGIPVEEVHTWHLWGKEESGRGELLVPHWSGSGFPGWPPQHAGARTPAPKPQPRLTEPEPLTMRLSLRLLLLLGAWAIAGGFGDWAPLTATAPQLDDEEKYSAHMPAHLRCDSCRAVVYQVSTPPCSSPAPVQVPPEARPLHQPQILPLAFDFQAPTPGP